MSTVQFIPSLAAAYNTGLRAGSFNISPMTSLTPQDTKCGSTPKLQFPLNGVMNFESLLGSELFSDISVKCGFVVFPAHKAILAGRSAVFKTMLSSGLEEVKSGVIHVTDMTASDFEIILRYLYTGKVNEEKLDCDLLLKIVHGAEKYGLEELKNYCFGKLAGDINDETAGAVAIAAHLYGAGEAAKDAVQKFIRANFFRLVEQEEFRKMVKQCNDAFF